MSNDALTHEEINALVAERLMGYDRKEFVKTEVEHFSKDPLLALSLWHALVPNFSTDLNACAEAEAKCRERAGDRYGIELERVVRWAHLSRHDSMWTRAATATAHQRCLAMLACMEEEK